MSDAQKELEKTISTLQQEVQDDLSKVQMQKAVQLAALPGREKTMQQHLTRARDLYAKKDWAAAFAEWDKACALLDEGHEFLKQVTSLRESHENLMHANSELAEVREILQQRSAPPESENQFLRSAHQDMSGKVKNVYSYISGQLRTERAANVPNFRWMAPVIALFLVAAATGAFWKYESKRRSDLRKQAEASVQTSRLEIAALALEREELFKKLKFLEEERAAWKNIRRSKTEELQAELSEIQRQNEEMTQKIRKLAEENLQKDRMILEIAKT